MNRFFKGLLKVAGALVVFYLVLLASLAWQLRTITDIDDYPDLLTNWDPDLVEHFPAAVPERATLKKVSYFPGFMQGGSHLQLRVQVPTPRVYSEEARLDLLAIMKFRGRELTAGRTVDAVLKDMPPTPFYTSEQGVEEAFPPDYTLYVLSAEPGDTDGFPWNHGRTRGVAVSRAKSELVYWAESW